MFMAEHSVHHGQDSRSLSTANKYYGPIHAEGNSSLVVGDVNYYGEQTKLKYVPGAIFNAYGLEHNACHPETRRDLLREINEWATDPQGRPVFWLNGMAGTGKSTIAYTVAERFHENHEPGLPKLGASFFFKRGERDQTSAALFFPTVVRQLCHTIPHITRYINHAIHINPDICDKALSEQFRVLLEGPFSNLGENHGVMPYIIVVDALDECQNEDDITTLLLLWSQGSQSLHQKIRWFVTSRPELPIDMGFRRMSPHILQNVVLHDMPPSTVKDDIFTFMDHAFSQIREEYNLMPLSGSTLSPDWPGLEVLDTLSHMAAPLFIVAATICRFIQDKFFDPLEQLDIILKSRKVGSQSDLGQVYLPILERAISCSASTTVREQIQEEFRMIVGAIITVAEPLSCSALAALLQISRSTISSRLRPMHSVLQVPTQGDEPIRHLHLSFADFLTSHEIVGRPFWISTSLTHALLLSKCLEVMSQPYPSGLHENMCQMSSPGQPRHTIPQNIIDNKLSPALRYACRHWIYHAIQSKTQPCDGGDVHRFLQTHFMHWVESLSLMGIISEAASYVRDLSLHTRTDSIQLSAFLEDARRFVLANAHICDVVPLQLYSSATIFAPQNCVIRQICGNVPGWVEQLPWTPTSWNAELLQLGSTYFSHIAAPAFSPDGMQLASVQSAGLIKMWSTHTGQEILRLTTDSVMTGAIAFSPDGSQLASGTRDSIEFWNVKTGQLVRKLGGRHCWLDSLISMVAFSPDGLRLASGTYSVLTNPAEGNKVRLWDLETGRQLWERNGRCITASSLAFSPDGTQLVWPTLDELYLYDAHAGREVRKFVNYSPTPIAVGFSADSSLVFATSMVLPIRVWNKSTGLEVRRLGLPYSVMALSSISSTIAFSTGKDIQILDIDSGAHLNTLTGHRQTPLCITFSPNDLQMASAGRDGTIRICDLKMKCNNDTIERHFFDRIVLSPDSSLAAAKFVMHDSTYILVANTRTGIKLQHLGPYSGLAAMVFSIDNSFIASSSLLNHLVVWNTKTGAQVFNSAAEDFLVTPSCLAFSPDGLKVAAASPTSIQMYETNSGSEIQNFVDTTSSNKCVMFSPDGSQLASADQHGTVQLWDTMNGTQKCVLKGRRSQVHEVTLAFSPNGLQLAHNCQEGQIQVLDTRSGELIHTLDVGDGTSRMEFLGDGRGLVTDSEIIHFDEEGPTSGAQARKPFKHLHLEDNWIVCGQEKILWLPRDYVSKMLVIQNNTLATVHVSGRLVAFRIEYPEETASGSLRRDSLSMSD